MPLLTPFRALSTLSSSSSSVALFRRRSPLVRALCVLSVSALLAGVAFRTGIAHSESFRSKLANRAVHSAGMDSASGSRTVPSIVVYVTVPNREAGKKLSESIIKEKLAACVNIVPGIESVYWWEGKVQTDSEELLIIKTRESLLPALTEHVKSNHEYEVPEVISLPITGGNDKYLEWIKNNTRDN
ncbi:hypothetical protein LUZ60_005704 [Juncus effusus]|nr:hypothetical protein LUZ60_005704 [Juncus effusus]